METNDAVGGFVLPVGTVTLLLADVEGSTRGWEQRAEELTEAIANLDELVGDSVGRHAGVMPVEQGEGDSFVAAFSRASDALACAAAIQSGLADTSLRLRIGLHTGEVQLRNAGNYVGTTINRTARLRDIAHGGQTVLSAATRDVILDQLPVGATLIDHGEHQLRDLTRPEHVFELVLPGLVAEFPELRSLSTAKHNLPSQLSSFIGRSRELTEAGELLAGGRLLTLVGAGGSGKTRLALHIAAAAVGHFDDGVWYCPLAQVEGDDRVMGAIAEAVSIREQQGTPLDLLVERSLNSRQLLLVLDNCEQIVEGVARIVDRLLRQCPELKVLATSREPLAVEGELTYSVPPLSLPDEREALSAVALSASEAVALFVDRARSARPNIEFDDDTAATVVRICRQLDAIPLAIELAAARTRVMPVDHILRGLQDRFRTLGKGPRTALPRQQTLLGSVAWSYDLLSDDERTVLRRASVFAGPFGLNGAEAVCSGGEIEPFRVLDLVAMLAERSMLVVADGPLPYRMLETIRQFARDRLVDAGEHDEAAARHIDHHAGRALAARLFDETRQRSFRDELKAGYDDVRAAIVRATGSSTPEAGLAIIDPMLGTIFAFEGKVTEGRALIANLMARLPDAARSDLVWANLNAGVLAAIAGDWMAAPYPIRQALEGAREAEDQEAEAISLAMLAAVQALVGDPIAAAADAERAVALARQGSNQLGAFAALTACAQAYTFAGRPHQAEVVARESISLGKRWGLPLGPSQRNLGRALLFTSQLPAAEQALERSLAEAVETLDTFATAECLLELAVVARWTGGYRDELAAQMHQALERAEADDDRFGRSALGIAAAWLAWVDGDYASMVTRARTAAQPAKVVAEFASGPHLHTAAMGHLALGDLDQARAVAPDAGSRPTIREDRHLFRGLLSVAEGDLEGAEQSLFVVLASDGDHDAPWWLELVEALGATWARGDRGVEGLRLIGAATTHRVRARRGRVPYMELAVSGATDAARATLGDDTADAALQEGQGISLDDAIELAMLGRGPRKRPIDGWASITPAEQRVLDLAATGLSNPQIAEQLFISQRTVSTHLSRVYAKLGISSRTELAAAVARRDAQRS